jgi:hypothetical protein
VIAVAQDGHPCGPECQSGEYEPTWPNAYYHAGGVGQILLRVLILPGRMGISAVLYPLFPWMAVTLFGIAHGFTFREDEKTAHGRTLVMAVVALALFVLLRLIGGPGVNFRGLPFGEGSSNQAIVFFFIE